MSTARRSRVATGRTNRSTASSNSSLDTFASSGRVSSSALSNAFSEPSSRLSYKRPSTIRSFGVRSDTSSARLAREHGHDLKSRIRDKVAETTKISSVFRKFDANKNGKVDHDEFARGIGQLGFDVDKRGLKSLLGWVDPDDRGEIEYGTFARLMSHVDGPGGSQRGRKKAHHRHCPIKRPDRTDAGLSPCPQTLWRR